MTLKNSSSHSRRSRFLERSGRRLWVIAFTIIPLLLWYAFGTMLVLSNEARRYNAYYPDINRTVLRQYLERDYLNYFTGGGASSFLIMCLAALIGIQGFSYLFSRQQVDFFESQPVSRTRRFAEIVWNGLAIFALCYGVCVLLSGVVALGYGVRSAHALGVYLFTIARDLLLFTATYAVAILAVMLTGNLIYAIFMTVALLTTEALVKIVVQNYMTRFFRTISPSRVSLPAPLSIPWHVTRLVVYAEQSEPLKKSLPHLIGVVVAGLIAYALSYVLYKKRRSEWAGVTLCHYPVHALSKFVLSVLGGLATAVFINALFFPSEPSATAAMFPWLMTEALLFTALYALIIEAAYRGSVKGALGTPIHIPVLMSMTFLALLIFKLDVFGYDRFFPTPEKIDSYALTRDDYYDFSYYEKTYLDEDGATMLDKKEYAEKYMLLTDVDALGALVALDAERFGNLASTEGLEGYRCEICYRMKNGKRVYRMITIPYDVDDALMERVVGSDAFKEGAVQVYHDEGLKARAGQENAAFGFDNGFLPRLAGAELYEEFAERYRDDLNRLQFKELATAQAAGNAMVVFRDSERLYQILFPVYPSFTETIAFLEAHDLFLATDLKTENLRTVAVGRWTDAPVDDNGNYDWISRDYENEDEIRQIMDAVVYYQLLSEWFNMDLIDGDCSVERVDYDYRAESGADRLYLTDYFYDMDGYQNRSYAYANRLLLKERVPAFLKHD